MRAGRSLVLTSMVDLVFILLIFFLLALSLQKPSVTSIPLHGLAIKQERQNKIKVLDIHDEFLMFMGERLNNHDLSNWLTQHDNSDIVLLRARDGVTWQSMRDVIDILESGEVEYGFIR
ncbi:MAG: biopolymer transporter ExbD [Alphaproteobacteria bacterium]